MSIDAARAFNQKFPPGSEVGVRLRDGTVLTGKLKGAAFVWSGMALIEINGLDGYWTVQTVATGSRPLS